MPINPIVGSNARYEFSSPISEEEISSIRENKEVKYLQSSQSIEMADWELLNNCLFPYRPDVELRVFGFYSELCDLSFLSLMNNVEIFSADCLMKASNVEAVGLLPKLKKISIGIYDLESFSFLDLIPSNVESISLHRTKSNKPNIKGLNRFDGLKKLYLEGQSRGIETLSRLGKLEKLTLRSITVTDFDFLLPLENLTSLELKLGGSKNASQFSKLKSLKYLEIWQVRGLDSLDFLSEMISLQNLFLQNLPLVTRLPKMEAAISLRRILLQSLKGLSDLSPLEFAPALEEFILLEAMHLNPIDCTPVLKSPNLKRACAFFGSNKKNREFVQYLISYNKEEYYYKEFEYR